MWCWCVGVSCVLCQVLLFAVCLVCLDLLWHHQRMVCIGSGHGIEQGGCVVCLSQLRQQLCLVEFCCREM